MKHRVILVNKFHYRRGGDCISMMHTERMLAEHGHATAVFAMDYTENIPSEWSRYWPAEVSFDGGIKAKLKASLRLMGMGDVAGRFRKLLREFRPDVVHLHNIHSYISPVVGQIAASKGVKVVWTLHDYKLVCPAYTCMRNGKICEECFTDSRRVIGNRCMKNSAAASMIAYAESLRWNRKKLESFTDRFICPSSFMAEKMKAGGFSADKITVLHNFISPEMAALLERENASAGHSRQREPYMCYVGRLSAEKGVGLLLEAVSELPFEIRIAGTGPMAAELQSRFAHNPGIRFLGHLDAGHTAALLANARMSVIASECYENNPLSVIESLCAGTPVVGSNIGGIPELISPDCGLTFTPSCKEALKTAIRKAWATDYDNRAIALRALDRFSSRTHYNSLIQIYENSDR